MSLVFFTDRDLGNQFPRILTEAGIAVEQHRDHFAPDTPDEDWLRDVAGRGWIAITHDRRIRYRPNELRMVVEHNATLLVVVGHCPYAELARSFVNTIPATTKFLARHRPPLIAKIYRASNEDLGKNPHAPGRIQLWYPRQEEE